MFWGDIFQSITFAIRYIFLFKSQLMHYNSFPYTILLLLFLEFAQSLSQISRITLCLENLDSVNATLLLSCSLIFFWPTEQIFSYSLCFDTFCVVYFLILLEHVQSNLLRTTWFLAHSKAH